MTDQHRAPAESISPRAPELSPFDWVVRTEVYRHLVTTTHAPSPSAIAASLDRALEEVEASLQRLATQHQLVLAPGGYDIWMAHPFSAIPTDFPVDTHTGRYWANCAWDTLGIAAVLAVDTRTMTRCAETGEPIAFGITDGRLVHDGALVHFAVPARAFYDNVAFT